MEEAIGQNQLTSETKPEKFWNLVWWYRRTKLERTLLLITVTSLLMVSIMAATLAALGHLYQKNIDSRQSNTASFIPKDQVSMNSLCLTPGCIRTAAEILLNTDESIDPCKDFYEFACGGWISRQTIPEDKSSVTYWTKLRDDIKLKLKLSLEMLGDSEPEFIKMLKWMYDSCMDLKSIEKSGAEPLKNVLKSLGGWPVVEGDKWKKWNFNWIDAVRAVRKLGYSHSILMSLYVCTNQRNNSAHVIYLDQPHLGISDRTYLLKGLNDSTTSAYFKMMVKSAMLLGVNETSSKNEMEKVLQFETALANFSRPREERRNVTKLYNKYTVGKLQEEFPQIPWLKYFDSLLNDKVYENETVIVYEPDFIRKFAELITSTEKRVVSNYMLWRVVHESLSLLSKEWRYLMQEYKFTVTGQKEEEPRWMQCLGSLKAYLPIALSSYYVRHYFKEETKEATSELVKYIQTEFLKILEEIDWMDEETKKHAKYKARIMKSHIGHPKELLNNTVIMEFYKNLTITNESYFENIMKLRQWSGDYHRSRLRKPNVKGEWIKHAASAIDVDVYVYWENSMEYTAGVLQPPFFSKDSPQYMNFGALGSIIGHKITHGFDDFGRQYDHDGNNVNWWDVKTDQLFKKKAQCIIDQYSNYTIDGMKVNGVNTQGENIADIGGLKQAYRAYRSWVKDHGNEQLLPGIKYTQNQMFWISSAFVSCDKTRPELNKLYMVSGYYNPDQFRVNGPVSNLPEFAKDFNCPLDSPMNKRERCQVW